MTAIDAFLTWAENDRRRSRNTLIRYRSVLRQMSEFGDPAQMGTDQVQDWWDSRLFLPDGSPRAESSRANELACARAFYKWATRFDLIEKDPTRRLDAPDIPNRLPRKIGKADLELLLGDATKDDLMVRRAIALGAYGGLRVSEAAAQDWSNIIEDGGKRRLLVRGKGLKERVIGVSPLLWDNIAPRTDGNVVSAGERPIPASVLQRRLNRLMARHKIDHTFHDLRKRGASILLANGANPVAVMQMFGWSSMETIKSYAVVEDDELDVLAAMIQ